MHRNPEGPTKTDRGGRNMRFLRLGGNAGGRLPAGRGQGVAAAVVAGGDQPPPSAW